jgi:hypothetical protein
MRKYDYRSNMVEATFNYIQDRYTLSDYEGKCDELEDVLFDDLIDRIHILKVHSNVNDFSAMDAVLTNMELLNDAIDSEPSYDEIDPSDIAKNFLNSNWQYFDNIIRRYLLATVVHNVATELKESGLI